MDILVGVLITLGAVGILVFLIVVGVRDYCLRTKSGKTEFDIICDHIKSINGSNIKIIGPNTHHFADELSHVYHISWSDSSNNDRKSVVYVVGNKVSRHVSYSD